MTTVNLTLNGRDYAVSGKPEDAPRLIALGEELRKRVEGLKAQLGGAIVSDAQLLVLVNLMVLDELDEARKAIFTAPQRAATPKPAADSGEEALMVQAVEHLTGRVISIAQKLRAA
jgi:cell division protein ZapA (FtsZ GTPase activity inhibitor)